MRAQERERGDSVASGEWGAQERAEGALTAIVNITTDWERPVPTMEDFDAYVRPVTEIANAALHRLARETK